MDVVKIDTGLMVLTVPVIYFLKISAVRLGRLEQVGETEIVDVGVVRDENRTKFEWSNNGSCR